MEPLQLYFSHIDEWSNWLRKNYQSKDSVWLIFYKKHTKITTLSYNDALDEALCFGWIDSLIKSIDANSYLRKFTQRVNLFQWSARNRIKVEKLIENGRMTEIGLNKIGDYQKTGKLVWPEEKESVDELSEEMQKMLQSDLRALDFFSQLSPSHKRNYIRWVMEAKRDETKIRRMYRAIEMLKNNQKNLLL